MTETSSAVLYGYFRSSASYRVRIALALKGLSIVHKSVDLPGGAQNAAGLSQGQSCRACASLDRRGPSSVAVDCNHRISR